MAIMDKLPEWAKHYGEAIQPYPPKGDWHCAGIKIFKSPSDIFHPNNEAVLGNGRYVFVPFYMDPIWSAAGGQLPYTVMVFKNIGADVDIYGRGFKDRCGL